MNEELVAGLRTALEHGETLENAIVSFVNAGYNESDVRAAAQQITQGATSVLAAPKESISPERTPTPTEAVKKTLNQPLPVRAPLLVSRSTSSAGALKNVPITTPIPVRAPGTLSVQQGMSPKASPPLVAPLPSTPSFSATQPKNTKMIVLLGISLFLLALIIVGIVFSSQIIALIDSIFS